MSASFSKSLWGKKAVKYCSFQSNDKPVKFTIYCAGMLRHLVDNYVFSVQTRVHSPQSWCQVLRTSTFAQL